MRNELNYRSRNLKAGYELKAVPNHGTGVYPVNMETNAVCECKMEWDKDGLVLSCPECGLDGT
tara:strand:+ start:1170 stop:1358 length:189 start_codon:yes stop_codon:yes gene_type:complete